MEQAHQRMGEGMRVLIGCEESQVGTTEFLKLGHDTYSCDLVDTRGKYPERHLKMDVKDAIRCCGPWDLIILHPDCTAMAVCGNSTYGLNKDKTPKPLHYKRLEAIEWTLDLWEIAVDVVEETEGGVCMENPQSTLWPPLREAGAVVQFIQPWQFGHMEQKKTGLGLHNLPPLEETNDVYDEMMKLPRKLREKKHFASPGPNRARDRSESYVGIMAAMAEQWGNENND